MAPERRQQIEELFEGALDRHPEERAAFLAETVGDDAELRAEVEALLAGHELTGGALEQPVARLAASLLEERVPERRIGPYRVLKELGRGGMGVVYLAERDDGQFRRRAAIKLVRSGLDDGQIHRRFLAERQILASLNHPNIAQLLEGGVTDGQLPYLVMEYVEGLPITEYCDKHRLGIEARLRLFQEVCAAVHHAHQNLVLHRDLKPSNIVVDGRGSVKLLDFGIAKLLNPSLGPADAPFTRFDQWVMTPEYASPEQVRGEPLTTASDVYSLGVILYELLTGHRPYYLTTRSPEQVLELVCERDPERPSTRAGQVEIITLGDGTVQRITPAHVSTARDTPLERLPRQLRGDLDAIAMMALRKEPGRRYGSAEMLSQDIQRHFEGLPVQAHSGRRSYRVWKFLRRHRVEAMAAALVGLSLMVGTGVASWQAMVARQQRDHAAMATAEAEQALSESQEVTDFLLGLFEANDPAQALGDEITARELLRRGIARIDDLQGQPLVQARMLDVVGQVYASLGQYDEAQPLIERALALRQAAYGAEHPTIAESLSHLAALLQKKGDYPAAERLYHEALAMRRSLLGDPHPDVALSVIDLAYQLHLQGDFGGAESLYHEALAMLRHLHGNEHPYMAKALNNLGLTLRSKGDLPAAEPILREALAMRRRLLGDDHPEVAQSEGVLAALLRRKGDYAAAEALYRASLERSQRLLGNEHPDVAHAINGFARLLVEEGQLQAADSLFRDVLAMRRRRLGEEHPAIASTLHDLGLVRWRLGDTAGADSLLHQALAIRRTLLGDAHPEVLRIRQDLALCCNR